MKSEKEEIVIEEFKTSTRTADANDIYSYGLRPVPEEQQRVEKEKGIL